MLYLQDQEKDREKIHSYFYLTLKWKFQTGQQAQVRSKKHTDWIGRKKNCPSLQTTCLSTEKVPKNLQKNIVELINGVAMHKMQKSIVFLYTSNKKMK